jgi:enoyl-CoA hydratase/carnithine racemase
MILKKNRLLELQKESNILIISINNPPNNYLSPTFLSELDHCRETMLSTGIEGIIFTGKGNVFSKGVDINEVQSAKADPDSKMIVAGNDIYSFISNISKPVVAAINGACLGGGLELALACHIRLCSDKARFGLPEVSIGLIPGLGGIQRLIRVVGESKALEMILLGDIISASRAYEVNLVSRVFPKKDFISNALLFTKTLVSAPKDAIEEVLKLFYLSRPVDEKANIDKAAEGFMRLLSIKKG